MIVDYIFRLSKKYDVVLTREPTRRHAELRAKMAASRDVREHAEWYATTFAADRREHLAAQIEPALAYGSHVVCDRYMYSTLAYQGAQGVPLSRLLDLHAGMRVPDLVLLLDVPVPVAQRRRAGPDATDVFDVADAAWLETLRASYLALPPALRTHPIVVIDATHPVADVFARIRDQLDRLFAAPAAS